MQQNKTEQKILDQIAKLEQKYEVMGQDLSSYLDGLLYADYLTYWDYIHLDTLLSLQNPKTSFPDERIFITYHQITELYFKMILWEIEQITGAENIKAKFFVDRMKRINRYFSHLISSFDIMVDGMEPQQFLKFRMALLPSSGFQTAQYRLIEITSSDLINLVEKDYREKLANESIEVKLDNLYWKKGATELATGKKTLTLRQFEEKYLKTFADTAQKYEHSNLWQVYIRNFEQHENKDEIKNILREYDYLANVAWRLSHFKSAVKYLQKDPEDIKATGGTNWQKYLPPRFQFVMFYPELYSAEEKENWGKQKSPF
jgi:tryptophan 2,3-dioxygenase